jgi:endonuclease/exonuclease/phosphatase family metal-dependent hydrolase
VGFYQCVLTETFPVTSWSTLFSFNEMKSINKSDIVIYAALFLFSINLSAQDFDELEFGTDSTFEILTWNIEWFPKNGQTTVDYVTAIIQTLDVDVLAIQEVDDTDMFDQMLQNLTDYEGYYESAWFAGLAYIYKTDVIEINDIYEIYTTAPYWSPFPRSPMVMDMTYLGENILIINNHFKCCGDGYLDLDDPDDEETRRYLASNLLKEYIDTNFSNNNVIVLGDLNDILTDDTENNVFQMILNDSENYLFADMEIATGNSSEWSYPWWPSHIDHILITNELFDEFENERSKIQTIKIEEFMDGGFDEYYENISDHRPVALKLEFISLSEGDVNEDGVTDIYDVNIFVDFILGNQIPTPSQIATADLNQDTIIDVMDIVLLVDLILGSTMLPLQIR